MQVKFSAGPPWKTGDRMICYSAKGVGVDVFGEDGKWREVIPMQHADLKFSERMTQVAP